MFSGRRSGDLKAWALALLYYMEHPKATRSEIIANGIAANGMNNNKNNNADADESEMKKKNTPRAYGDVFNYLHVSGYVDKHGPTSKAILPFIQELMSLHKIRASSALAAQNTSGSARDAIVRDAESEAKLHPTSLQALHRLLGARVGAGVMEWNHNQPLHASIALNIKQMQRLLSISSSSS